MQYPAADSFKHHSDIVEPHVLRAKEMIVKHPEIKQLMGRNPWSFLIILSILGIQFSIAYLMSGSPWWMILIVAYCIGAFCNHGLFVFIHEATHDLIFRKRLWNIWAGILCDVGNTFPTFAGFRKYHLKHHSNMGDYDFDADMPSEWERKIVGNSSFMKALWLFLFPFVQGFRPARLKQIQFSDKWIWINLFTILFIDIAIVYFLGWKILFYMFASFYFSISLHPLGARWIQEHYIFDPKQETYNYYGPLNKVQFNIGYHNEHHDFASIPWNKLPDLTKTAPEFYNKLLAHQSWVKLLFRFLSDKNINLNSRMERRHEVFEKAGRGQRKSS